MILIVEDRAEDAELIFSALENGKAIKRKIKWLQDGEALLNYFEEDRILIPAFILLDLKIPKLNGIEVTKALRKNDKTKNIPIIMHSSSAEISDIKNAYDSGINSYLVKEDDLLNYTNKISTTAIYWSNINTSLN